jgi:hypothetical protein
MKLDAAIRAVLIAQNINESNERSGYEPYPSYKSDLAKEINELENGLIILNRENDSPETGLTRLASVGEPARENPIPESLQQTTRFDS